MDFILLSVFVISLLGIKYRNSRIEEHMCLTQTSSINGIFVMFVFLRHFGQYISYEKYDLIFHSLDNKLGQLIVTTFLFYSGYGVMYSIMNKDNYVSTLPRRILRILLQFDMAIVLFIVANAIIGKYFSLSDYLLSFVCWTSIGNSNWYVLAILCMYLVSYIATVLFPEKHLYALLVIFLGCFIYIFLMHIGGKEQYVYDTIFCYPLGGFYALYYGRICCFISKKKCNPLLNCLSAFAICVCSHILSKQISYPLIKLFFVEIKSASFVWTIVALTTIFVFSNPLLTWLGKYVFEIYILQRIPMLIFQDAIPNKYVYFIVSFAITIFLAILFKRAEKLIGYIIK